MGAGCGPDNLLRRGRTTRMRTSYCRGPGVKGSNFRRGHAVWSTFAGDSPAHGAMTGWLWSETDFNSYKGPSGAVAQRVGQPLRYLAVSRVERDLPGDDDTRAAYELDGSGSKFTVVYSTGTFPTYDGKTINNHPAGAFGHRAGEVSVPRGRAGRKPISPAASSNRKSPQPEHPLP
jgi:hypothetical protein